MKILHISDLHLYTLRMPFSSIFSKRLLGQLNLWLRRRLMFNNEDTLRRLESLTQQGYDKVILTGDLTTTAQDAEFKIALNALEGLIEEGKLLLIPGNHDRYLPQSNGVYERFFRALPYMKDEFEMAEWDLGEGRILIGIEMAKPTGIIYADGEIRDSTLELLTKRLDEIKDKEIWLTGHFPILYPEGYRHSERRALRKDQRNTLLDLISRYKIRYYLHGHEHKNWVIKRDACTFINSGSFGKRGIATVIEGNEVRQISL